MLFIYVVYVHCIVSSTFHLSALHTQMYASFPLCKTKELSSQGEHGDLDHVTHQTFKKKTKIPIALKLLLATKLLLQQLFLG